MAPINRHRRQAFAVIGGWLASLSPEFLTIAHAQKANVSTLSSSPKEAALNVSNYKDATVTDPSTYRVIDLRVRIPKNIEANQKVPLIIYSPGLGSGIGNGAPWCDAWQKAGFIVVTLSHPVTNDSIWDTKNKSLKANLQAALAGPQYGLRVADCQYVITQCLTKFDFHTNIDPKKIGIAGHSFGALTVQAITGQAASKHDPRIKAAIALSPTAGTPESVQAMGGVKIPFLCVMGDHDEHVTFKDGADSMTLGVPLAKRRSVYSGLPIGNKQLLILGNADHMTFAGEVVVANRFSRDLPMTEELNQDNWKRVSEITTDFWKSYFSDKPLAEQRTQFKSEVESIILKGDIFEIG